MGKPLEQLFSPDVSIVLTGYPRVARLRGGTGAHFAGQATTDPSGQPIGDGNFEAQAEQVFRNLKTAVEAAGGSMADVVRLNIYLVAAVVPSEMSMVRAVRDRYVDVDHPPVSTLVVMTRLGRPGSLVEVEAVLP